MKIRVKTEATTEPVTVSAAKEVIRVDGTWSDNEIAALIKAGRMAAEDFANISIPVKTLELAFDGYPPDAIELPKGPLVSLEAITLTGMDGTTVSVATTNYIEDKFASRVVRKTGAARQTVTLQETNGFVVEYKAGYAEVPEPIKEAILLYTQARYNCVPPSEFMPSFKSLLYPYKVVTV